MNTLQLATKRSLSETDCISILSNLSWNLNSSKPVSGAMFVMLSSEVAETKAMVKHPVQPTINLHYCNRDGLVPSPVPPQIDQSENWSRWKPALLVGIKEPCNNSPPWKSWSRGVGNREKGDTKQQKPLLTSSNRKTYGADKKKKKVAVLTPSASLIKADNCSLPAWPLGITLTYS